jgi:hypothetical protein
VHVRLFTVDEANALLPRLGEDLKRAQVCTKEMRELRDQLVDLRIVWEDKIEDPSCPDHAEYTAYQNRFNDTERRLQDELSQIHALGAIVKDIENGLVDFNARRGDDIVLLCWRQGESAIAAWHNQTSGYSGRRPLAEF